MAIEIHATGMESWDISAFAETDGARIPQTILQSGENTWNLNPTGKKVRISFSAGEFTNSKLFKDFDGTRNRIIVELKTLNGFQRLINWIFGAVFSPIKITTQKKESRFVHRAEATVPTSSIILPQNPPRFVTFVSARNVSNTPVERVNVYMEGKETPILGTFFDGINNEWKPVPTFLSSVARETPYHIRAYVKREEHVYSAEMEVKERCTLDIDIEKTRTVLRRYKGRFSDHDERGVPEKTITFKRCT